MKQSTAPATALTTCDFPEPPADLSEQSKGIWQAVIGRARSPGRRLLLQVALQTLDRANQAGALLQTEGLIVTTATTGATHLNPLAKLERDNRALFARIWHDQLAFGFDPTIDGRQG
jgi:hypothetical protein